MDDPAPSLPMPVLPLNSEFHYLRLMNAYIACYLSYICGRDDRAHIVMMIVMRG